MPRSPSRTSQRIAERRSRIAAASPYSRAPKAPQPQNHLCINQAGTKFLKGVTKVPESCIQAAEHIIQAVTDKSSNTFVCSDLKTRETFTLSGAKTRGLTKDVWLEFKDHKINISKTDLIEVDYRRVKSYQFNQLPAIGEGIGLINKGKDAEYNMHFGAVVSGTSQQVDISNMMEKEGEILPASPLETKRIRSVGQFRNVLPEEMTILIGKLTIDPPVTKEELKEKV